MRVRLDKEKNDTSEPALGDEDYRGAEKGNR